MSESQDQQLSVIVDDIEAVPEAVRSFYGQMDDGRYRLKAEGLEGDSDAEKLKRSLAAVKADLAKERERAKGFEGIDPEEYSRLKGAEEKLKLEEEERELKEAERKGEFEKVRQADRDKYQAEIDKLKKAHEQEVQRRIAGHLDREATEAIAKSGARPEYHDLLRAKVMPHLKGDPQEDGGIATNVIDERGTVRKHEDELDKPFTASDLLNEFRKSYPDLFQGRGASGAGTTGSENGGGARVYTRSEFANLSPAKQMEVGRKAAKGEITIED